MELSGQSVSLILTGVAALISAFKIPDIIKFFKDRDKAKIEKLNLHINELKKEIKLEVVKRETKEAELNILQLSITKTQTNFDVLVGLLTTTNIERKEIIAFINELIKKE